jgi:16S rRNA processing protein RimM
MDQDTDLHIGTIVGAHGIKGYLKLHSSAETTDFFFKPGKRLSLHRLGKEMVFHTVFDFQPHNKGYRIAFEGVTTRDAAEHLIGCELYIKRSELPAPEKDAWYWCDLIGLEVFQTDHTHIGRIENIFSTGANDVFVVKAGRKEMLIPAIASVIRHIDLDQKSVTVELPEGL